jgi:lipooligosaccharide transport system permease protein
VSVLAPRLTDYWITVWRRTWKGTAVTSFVIPFLTLTGMGVGLGTFIDDNTGAQDAALGGLSYLAYIGPGLLAVTAMQTAIEETTFPIMSGFKWHRFYFSMAASPLEVSDIVAAQLAFVAMRVLTTCTVFLGVLAVYGALDSVVGSLLTLPVVVLLGLSYGAPMAATSARMKSEAGFSLVFRLGLMPMVLFSGAFFPIDQLPDFVRWLAYVTPIWHGVELCRMLTSGTVELLPCLAHLAYLSAFAAVGWVLAVRYFGRRLIV